MDLTYHTSVQYLLGFHVETYHWAWRKWRLDKRCEILKEYIPTVSNIKVQPHISDLNLSELSKSTIYLGVGSYWSPIVISVFVLENTELYPVLLCLSTQLCYIIRSKSNFILQGITDIVFLLENCSSISLLWQQKCSASFQPKFIPYLCSCSTANLPPSFPLPTA